MPEATPSRRVSVLKPQRRATSFDPEVAQAFGTVVRRRREARQVAQDAFALAAGIDRSYYGKLERGERQPSLAILLRIASALDESGAAILSSVRGAASARGLDRESTDPVLRAQENPGSMRRNGWM